MVKRDFWAICSDNLVQLLFLNGDYKLGEYMNNSDVLSNYIGDVGIIRLFPCPWEPELLGWKK